MAEERSNFDNFFRDRFNNYQDTPPPDGWEKIKPNLPGKNHRPWVYFIPVALILVIVGLIELVDVDNNITTDIPSDLSKMEQKEEKTEQNKTSASEN